jgi:hypothetical protein
MRSNTVSCTSSYVTNSLARHLQDGAAENWSVAEFFTDDFSESTTDEFRYIDNIILHDTYVM